MQFPLIMSKCDLPFLCLFLTAFLISPGTCQSGNGNDIGYFSISSVPGEAQVIMDGIYRGNTPLIVPVSIEGSNSHTITV